MPVVYRPACAQDLERAEALVVASINDLTERHSFGAMATARPPNFQLFSLKDDPDGLWVAKDADEILGFAWSWVCGDLWFLAQLFVAPGHQGRGIGNELLQRPPHPQHGNGTVWQKPEWRSGKNLAQRPAVAARSTPQRRHPLGQGGNFEGDKGSRLKSRRIAG
jgi:GNAT superfamily N-acetyltransferase